MKLKDKNGHREMRKKFIQWNLEEQYLINFTNGFSDPSS